MAKRVLTPEQKAAKKARDAAHLKRVLTPEQKARKSVREAARRADNPEERRAWAADRHATNQDVITANQAARRAANPEKYKAEAAAYYITYRAKRQAFTPTTVTPEELEGIE